VRRTRQERLSKILTDFPCLFAVSASWSSRDIPIVMKPTLEYFSKPYPKWEEDTMVWVHLVYPEIESIDQASGEVVFCLSQVCHYAGVEYDETISLGEMLYHQWVLSNRCDDLPWNLSITKHPIL
jgi:hypothetical protein